MKTQVLIIGGGFGGATIAKKLEKSGIKVILVDKKDYFEVTYAVLRDVAAPSKTNGDARRYYDEFLNGSFIQGNVKTLSTTSALLDNGDSIAFDKVVIASGTRYPSLPLAKSSTAYSLAMRNMELADYHEQLQAASQVLILGGGVVGVELAGELAYAFPQLKITLAHRKSELLNGFNKKAQEKALMQLTNLGVNVEFNTAYQETNGVYKDNLSAKSINPDMTFFATGTMPNNEFLQKALAHILNADGFINVDANLAVRGVENFYAIGDIADTGEAKLGYLAVEQGKYLAKALVKTFNGQKVKPYKRHPFMALVPTGQKTGVVQLPFMVSTLRALVNIKQKDLFISKTFKEIAHS